MANRGPNSKQQCRCDKCEQFTVHRIIGKSEWITLKCNTGDIRCYSTRRRCAAKYSFSTNDGCGSITEILEIKKSDVKSILAENVELKDKLSKLQRKIANLNKFASRRKRK